MVYALGGVPLLSGIPFGPNSKAFYVDPANGSNSNDGLTPKTAVAAVATAYAKTTSGNNDVVFFIAGATSDQPAATITWANSYTHLIGLSSPVPGVGQRCRIVGTAGNDLTSVVTVTGDGCIFRNVQIANFGDADVDAGAAVVSGSRNAFYNVFFAGMGHATPGARAGSYSLTVSGEENHFERCSIGLDTIVRAAANAELVIATGAARLTFWDCRILSQSSTAGKLAVDVNGLDRFLEFKDCLFQNFSTNWAQALDNAIDDDVATTHYIILRGACQFVGFTGIADTVTYIYGAGAAPNAGMFLSTQPTT
jgi:protein-disulfide isomerase